MFEKLKGKTILLVEDEAVIRDNIASMLKFFFKKVYTASDGFEGLDEYEANLPDIVMTDLKMPNMGGFELLEELRNRSSHAYTIIVSAHTDKELLIQAIHDGVDRYLIKPLTEDELFATFNAYLEKLDKETPDQFELGDGVTVDFDRSEAVFSGETSHLNKKEILLLKLLMQDAARTFTYEEIENQVWGSKSMSLPALRSVVRDLRKKVGQAFVINVSGTGYRLK
jgi:DNA-binding response OmpR family regulator